MSAFTPYLVICWLVVMVGAFPSLRPRRSVLVAVLGGTMFLPELLTEVSLGPFHFSKYHAVGYAALLGALLFDSEHLLSGRPRWVDLPMLVWCLCPLPSVLTNDPPPDGSSALRDALAQTWAQIVGYGIPYLLGRVYFSDSEGMRDLVLGVVLAGVIYAPLCLFEARMSPQLHNAVYGHSQHAFNQTIRFGGYRPMVFFPHGLALAMFMVSACLGAVWLARSPAAGPEEGAERADEHRRLRYAALILVPTTVLLKSAGALGLGLVGAAVLWLARATGARVWLLALAAVPGLYVGVRATGEWSGESAVELVKEHLDADRAGSLEFRLQNEDLLVQKAWERSAFGWGGWGRNRLSDQESGQDITVTDGLWIIVFGDRGLVGLAALGAVLLLPTVRFALRFAPGTWSDRAVAPAAVCAVILTLWAIDCLLNAMVLPMYLLIAGALARFPAGDAEPAET